MPVLPSAALESAAAAQLLCFACFLLWGARRRSPALYFLAAVTGVAGLAVAINLVGSQAAGGWRNDVNLFLELLLGPSIYLYLRHIQPGARRPRPIDGLHAAPALAGLVLWKTHLLGGMDAYVVACWVLYLAAAWETFLRNFRSFEIKALRHFLLGLMAALTAVAALRAFIAFGQPPDFGKSPFYALMLGLLVGISFGFLFTALRHPDLLTSPIACSKYLKNSATAAALNSLDRSLRKLLADEKPFLRPELTLEDLAARLKAQPRHLSQLINARFGMNFRSFINAMRADEAARLLAADQSSPVKAVMFDSGFRSKSAFNREFHRRFGATPSDYRRGGES